MYLPFNHERRGEGENPEKSQASRHHNGYPETRDPAAENPRGVMVEDVGAAVRRKLAQRYAPTSL